MEQGRSRGERGVYLRPDSERPGQMEASARHPRVEHTLTLVGSGESEFFRFELHQGDWQGEFIIHYLLIHDDPG